MDPLMQLVVGWTLVGGFVFTMAVTLLSMVGVVTFAERRQQRALFGVLVLELVVGVGGKAAGAWRFDAGAVGSGIHADGQLVGGAKVSEVLLPELSRRESLEASRETVAGALERLELPQSSGAAGRRAELVGDLRVAPDAEALAGRLVEIRSARLRPR